MRMSPIRFRGYCLDADLVGLVMLMTPGLAFFYGGLVRHKTL